MLGESLKGENVVNQKVLVYVSDEAFSSALQPVNCPLEVPSRIQRRQIN
jgi:hypothetical protein